MWPDADDLTYNRFKYKFLNRIGDAQGTRNFSQLNDKSTSLLLSHSPVTDKPVLVTGIGGYVACHILETLLTHGYRHIRGTVRSKKPEHVKHLTQIMDKFNTRIQNERLDTLSSSTCDHASQCAKLELFEADLLVEGSFDHAVSGCEYVIHTASPFVLDVKDNQRDLVDPAKLGTLNVLRSCDKFGVKKVVLTSSIAAVTEAGVSTAVKPMKLYTENDWNRESSLTQNAYYYSKRVAEEAAVEYVDRLKREKGDRAMKLVVINPTLVWGPSHTPSVNQSVLVVDMVLRGEFPLIFNFNWCIVDVRDVAKAHILAMENPNASGRYLCGNETLSMRYLCEVLHKHFPYMNNVPRLFVRSRAGDVLVCLDTLRRPSGLGTYIRSNIGKICFVDNTKIVTELGMTFTRMEQTIVDTTQSLIDWKSVPIRSKL